MSACLFQAIPIQSWKGTRVGHRNGLSSVISYGLSSTKIWGNPSIWKNSDPKNPPNGQKIQKMAFFQGNSVKISVYWVFVVFLSSWIICNKDYLSSVQHEIITLFKSKQFFAKKCFENMKKTQKRKKILYIYLLPIYIVLSSCLLITYQSYIIFVKEFRTSSTIYSRQIS